MSGQGAFSYGVSCGRGFGGGAVVLCWCVGLVGLWAGVLFGLVLGGWGACGGCGGLSVLVGVGRHVGQRGSV